MSRGVRVVVDGLRAGEQTLDATASRHLVRVHRLKAGGEFVAVDPAQGVEARAEVLSPHVRSARVAIGTVQPLRSAELPPVTLLQALGKGDKGDQVVRAATALGASRIVFVSTERSVPRPRDNERRQTRWRSIAAQAARQSIRPDAPEVLGPLPLAEVLAETNDSVRLVLDPDADETLLSAVRDPAAGDACTVLIGPEGGLSETELRSAAEAGFTRVRFGPFILRTEIAAIAVLGALMAQAELRRAQASALGAP